jgi:hypothetical protein
MYGTLNYFAVKTKLFGKMCFLIECCKIINFLAKLFIRYSTCKLFRIFFSIFLPKCEKDKGGLSVVNRRQKENKEKEKDWHQRILKEFETENRRVPYTKERKHGRLIFEEYI